MDEWSRGVLFWGVCMPTRLVIASQSESPLVRVAAAVVSYRWLTGMEDGHTGFFGGKAWWADERWMHGVLWGLYAASGNGLYLYGDAGFGAINWLTH